MTNERIDFNDVDKYAQKYATMWFALRLEWLGALVLGVVFFGISILRSPTIPVFFSVMLIMGLRNYTDAFATAEGAGQAGIAMSYTAGITSLISFFSLLYSETEIRVRVVSAISVRINSRR